MSALYVIDYILLFITALFLFFSIWKGFIQSILGLMTWIGSILITLFFYEELSNYLTNKINEFPIKYLKRSSLKLLIKNNVIEKTKYENNIP